jgi:hypothetical protein
MTSLSPSGKTILLLLCLSCGLLLVIAGCRTPPQSASVPAPPVVQSTAPVTPTVAPAAAEFVGNAACRSCHANEFREHSVSRHALTLRPATRAALGKLAPRAGKLPDSQCVIEEVNGGFRVRVPNQKENAEMLQFALGSGKTGMTFISVMNPYTIFEMRGSYFPHSRTWYLTPGQKGIFPDDLGVDHINDVAQKCIQCHAVTTDPIRLTPEPKFYGVGCESCHGAGSRHIAAMQTGQKPSEMEKLGTVGATRLNELCGKCHRTAAEVDKLKPSPAHTARFQPYGLMKSRCFQESNDTLSCLTCHQPHTNVSSNRLTYEKACLSCHDNSASASNTQKQVVTGKACPVNPRTGCIPCHMPKREVLPTSDVDTMMADHDIRVFRSKPQNKGRTSVPSS